MPSNSSAISSRPWLQSLTGHQEQRGLHEKLNRDQSEEREGQAPRSHEAESSRSR
jgi:hypothetical protein